MVVDKNQEFILKKGKSHTKLNRKSVILMFSQSTADRKKKKIECNDTEFCFKGNIQRRKTQTSQCGKGKFSLIKDLENSNSSTWPK